MLRTEPGKPTLNRCSWLSATGECLPGACVRNVLGACSHAGSVSSPSQTRPGALAHCATASFPQETGSFPLDIPSPFLLGLWLLKGLCSERMDHVASTA